MEKINYKDYWCYKEIREYGHKVEVKQGEKGVEVIIRFYDDDIYTDFLIEEFYVLDEKMLVVTNQGEDITECLEFTQTIEECVKGCLYYFWSRY